LIAWGNTTDYIQLETKVTLMIQPHAHTKATLPELLALCSTHFTKLVTFHETCIKIKVHLEFESMFLVKKPKTHNTFA